MRRTCQVCCCRMLRSVRDRLSGEVGQRRPLEPMARPRPAHMQLQRAGQVDRMFVVRAVARPAVCGERGLRWMGQCRASTHRGGAMREDSEVYVGLDTAKLKISAALAEAGRDGEVRFLGEIDSAPEAVERLVRKLAKRHRRMALAYEAGPTRNGRQGEIAALRPQRVGVPPSLMPQRPGGRG